MKEEVAWCIKAYSRLIIESNPLVFVRNKINISTYEKNERTICFNYVNFPNMRSILKGLVANKENKGLVYITNFDS